MASTEHTNSAQHSEKEARPDANSADTQYTKGSTASGDGVSDVGLGLSRDASPASPSSASGLKGGTQSPVPSGTAVAPPLSMPHPKKFSHVNINKKFLEKTSASTPTHTLSSSPVSKAANPSQKSIPQNTASHPRLVTAKLTATSQPSGTGGWSRPPSAVSSTAPTPLPTNSKPSSAPTVASNAAPLPPPVGKVIQPQPRSSQDATSTRKDASTKPVWGTAKPIGVVPDRVQADFPTAAEVAQAGRVLKPLDKVAPDAALTQKQAAEEDTFRGVHLDPNAHHWDEMEEDDDNFLGGVIEFEDGRQYKIQPSDGPRQASPRNAPMSLPLGGPETSGSSGVMDRPVSKEERFADDFDRSWPRSRPPPQSSSQFHDQRSNGPPTSPSSASVHSPQEASRQLFNERLNRLEPYSHQRQVGPGGPSHFTRRGSRSDYATSPTEPRRDAPPHAHTQGMQLLQKAPNGSSAESLPYSRAPGDHSPLSPVDGSRFRDRPPVRRDHPPWQGNGHPGPDHGRSVPHGMSHGRPLRDAPPDDQRRISAHESSFATSGGDHRRQLPPHLSAPGPRHVPPAQVETHITPRSPVPPPSNTLPPSEPAAPSATSQTAESPVASSPVALPAGDLEEVRKAAMHNAAERARLRRQQEEEEREKEKERARRKAAEIEERMKAKEQEKTRECEKAEAEKQCTEAQVLGIIEEAVTSVTPLEKNPEGLQENASQRDAATRPPMAHTTSSRGTGRPFVARRMSSTTAPSVASEMETWRRMGPPATLVARSKVEQHEPSAPLVIPPPVLAHADLDVKEGEDVDVVDFADFGKLVGSEDAPRAPVVDTPGRVSRAVAADFFTAEEAPALRYPAPPPSKADEATWRRRSSVTHNQPTLPEKPMVPASVDDAKDATHVAPESSRSSEVAGPNAMTSHPLPHEEHHRRASGHHQNGAHKLPPGPHYREAPMSTLNDVISRIKGVLEGVRSEADIPRDIPQEALKEEPKEEPKPPQKWLPPALRPRLAQAELATPTEVFDVTSAEPPKSPKKAWNIFTVRLASVPRPALPPQTTELIWPRGARPFRLDAHSWNPPMDIQHRRGSTVNDLIFGGPHYIKGQPKYYVSLPRNNITRRPPLAEQTSTPPIVNLPTSPPRAGNMSLKESTMSSWRKAPASPAPSWRTPLPKDATQDIRLDTVSRSPPPETPSTKMVVPADAVGPLASTSATTKPKMPFGSDVAFYRNARVETATDPQATVRFIVSSELESGLGHVVSESKPVYGGSSVLDTTPAPVVTTLAETKADAPAAGIRELANGSYTPPPQPPSTLSQWTKSPKAFKEAPSRAPDPEHLKAVWSQTSDKAQIQPVNSLKGIADDLTGVPFSLQDVKSDDGGTPPPPGSGPWSRSRMSPYEVTRAFQQVPSPSSSSSQAHPQPVAPALSSSSSTNGSAPRHPGFAFSPPPGGQPGLRPAYATYSPMMSHTPSPTVMYSHASPIPRPMVVNGNAPAYGQPVWMPAVPGQGPPPPGGLMRPPYPTQLVAYPSPGGAVQMYSHIPGMQNPPAQQNGAQGRPPGMAMVSPVMQPALPHMYAGSPVLVHAPPIMPPGQSYPTPTQSNRGPMRPYDQTHGTSHMHSPMRQPPQNGYNTVPSGYAARPPW